MKKVLAFLTITALVSVLSLSAKAQESNEKKSNETGVSRENSASFKGTGFGDPARNSGTRGVNKAPKAPGASEKAAEKKEDANKNADKKEEKEQPKKEEEKK